MGSTVEVWINGERVAVPAGVSVAAALLCAGRTTTRRSVTGAPRAPLCGMGTCYECRVTIDDVPHRRACLEPVVPEMRITTDA